MDERPPVRLRVDVPSPVAQATPPVRVAPPPGPSFADRVRSAPTTYAICAINVAVFLYVEAHGSSTDVVDLVRFGALERSHVWAGEYWRLVTPMFLHIGWVHLLWNTYALAGWCGPVERVLGRPRFLAAYLITGMSASAVSLLCHDVTGAGASGAAFGIVGVTLALRWRALGSWPAFTADRWVRSTTVTMVIWTVIGFTAVRMDNFAHAGGLAAGGLMGALYVWTPARSPAVRVAAWAAFAALMVGLLASATHRWPWQASVWEQYESAVRAAGTPGGPGR
jgi:membrane associated rhomboid family serine protease